MTLAKIAINLFSMFDPATPNWLSSNWTSLILVLILYPLLYFLPKSNLNILIFKLTNFIFSEFKPLVKKIKFILISPITVFILILSRNLIGLLPYVFTHTRHLVVSISLALTAWIAILLYSFFHTTENTLTHLTPQGAPQLLAPFLVLIEVVRRLIRPITLSVRLSANIIAGHLIITLLATNPHSISIFSTILLRELLLLVLEIAVAIIQAYVFRVLITLYSSEPNN